MNASPRGSSNGGVIDLETAIPPGNPDFRGRWFLEGSNGVCLTALVIVPLLVVAMAPLQAGASCRQLHVLSGSVALAAILCLDPLLLLRIAMLELTAAAVWLSLRNSGGAESGRARRWTLVGIVATFGGLPLLFGLDSYTPKVMGLLAGIIGLAVWLAFTPSAGTALGQCPVRPSPLTWPMFVAAALGAVLVEAHDEWLVTAEGRYLSEHSMALVTEKTDNRAEVAKPELMTA